MCFLNTAISYLYSSKLPILSILISAVLTLLLLYIQKMKRSYQKFKNMNLPGPNPRFFLGNLIELYTSNQHSAACLDSWAKEYGKIFGYFVGHTPILCVSDPDLLQEIFVTKFSYFHARRKLPLQRTDLKHLFSSAGDEWKRQRLIMQPAFNHRKINEMHPIIEKHVNELVKKLDEKDPTVEFDIMPLFQRTAMDIMLDCAFGIDTLIDKDLSEKYYQRCSQVFNPSKIQIILSILSMLLPELDIIWTTYFKCVNIIRLWLHDHIPFISHIIGTDPNTWLICHAKNIIQNRYYSGKKRKDLLQSMIDASETCPKAAVSLTSSQNYLTEDELSNNIYIFMLAGYETTATALSYLAYILATHQEEQEHLQKEIDAVSDNYGELMKLEYLDWCIFETLRLYPVAPFVINRRCNQRCRIGQLDIGEGTYITANLMHMHYSEKLFGPLNPFEFHPERFQEKRHPLAWLPFGAGPRNCMGMQFAIVEMKLVLTKLLHRYTILAGKQTLSRFDVQEKFVIVPKNGVWIHLKRREIDDITK